MARERIYRFFGAVPGNPLRPFTIGYLWFVVISSLVALGIYLSPIDPVWSLIVGVFPAGSIIVLPVIVLVGRPYVQSMRTITSDYWVRWSFTNEEWSAFEEQEWAAVKREMRLWPIFIAGITLVMTAFSAGAARNLGVGLLTGGVLLAAGVFAMAVNFGIGAYRYAKRGRSRGDVFISQSGVLLPRGYVPISGFNLGLVGVTVERGDVPTLRLRTGSRTENLSKRIEEFRVPIPRGREAEAEELAQRLLGYAEARRGGALAPG